MNLNNIISSNIIGTTYFLLQGPALALAIWSFKLNKNLFNATPADKHISDKHISNKSVKETINNTSKDTQDNQYKYFGTGLLKHEKGNIFTAGVCKLGKIAGWIIIFQIILSTSLLFSVNVKKTKYKDTILAVAIENTILLLFLIIPASIMNPELSIRTIPFYILEIGINIYLFTIYSFLRKIHKYENINNKIDKSKLKNNIRKKMKKLRKELKEIRNI